MRISEEHLICLFIKLNEVLFSYTTVSNIFLLNSSIENLELFTVIVDVFWCYLLTICCAKDWAT